METMDMAAYLKTISELLSNIDHKNNPIALQNHMLQIVSHRATLITYLANAESELAKAKDRLLPHKSTGIEFDRKIKLGSLVSDYQYKKDILEGYVDTIDKEISICQTMLSFEKQHMMLDGTSYGEKNKA